MRDVFRTRLARAALGIFGVCILMGANRAMSAEPIIQPIDPPDLYSSAAYEQNLYGRPLQACSKDLHAGADRSGYCRLSIADLGVHGVCAQMTEDFLSYTLSQGNDLITPRPDFRFPGLKPGDFWCVCAGRWQQALDAGVAPPVNPEATSYGVLATLFASDLNRHLIRPSRVPPSGEPKQ
jgi:uncharacterized protein (DUF2237 family)